MSQRTWIVLAVCVVAVVAGFAALFMSVEKDDPALSDSVEKAAALEKAGAVSMLAHPTQQFGDDSNRSEHSGPRAKLDPAAWGDDHVGKPLPDFVSGDECLFCHRMDVGPAWANNRHQLTIRPGETDSPAIAALRTADEARAFADDVEFVLGRKSRIRYLKQTERYGQLALLSTAFGPSADGKKGAIIKAPNAHWDAQTFGSSCAGCHASGVDASTQMFSAVSLDCFTCHGDVPLEHSRDTTQVLLSKQRGDSARVVVSICGQCHIRTAKSHSTGLPYANQFVAGDNLFRDLHVDWSDEHLESLNPADRHVLDNVRDVALYDESRTTCLSCHEVHSQSSQKHQQLSEQAICAHCHEQGDYTVPKTFEIHSRTCEY